MAGSKRCGVGSLKTADRPVTAPAPVQGTETAVTRRYNGGRDPEGKPDVAWLPPACLLPERAIAACTLGYAPLPEKDCRPVEAGKRADLAALEKNPFKVPALKVHTVPAAYASAGGKLAHERK